MLLFGVHLHQPPDNLKEVVDKAFELCYIPLFETLRKYPEFKFSLHVSGWLFEEIKGKGQIPVEVLYFGENDDKFFIRLDGNVKNKELFVFINDNKIEYNGTVNEIAEFEIEKSNLPDEFDLKIEVFEDGKLLQILPSTPLAIQINSVYYKNWYI